MKNTVTVLGTYMIDPPMRLTWGWKIDKNKFNRMIKKHYRKSRIRIVKPILTLQEKSIVENLRKLLSIL